jgi:hypothetical protein
VFSNFKCGHPTFIADGCAIRDEEELQEISPEQTARAVQQIANKLCYSCLIQEREKAYGSFKQDGKGKK